MHINMHRNPSERSVSHVTESCTRPGVMLFVTSKTVPRSVHAGVPRSVLSSPSTPAMILFHSACPVVHEMGETSRVPGCSVSGVWVWADGVCPVCPVRVWIPLYPGVGRLVPCVPFRGGGGVSGVPAPECPVGVSLGQVARLWVRDGGLWVVDGEAVGSAVADVTPGGGLRYGVRDRVVDEHESGMSGAGARCVFVEDTGAVAGFVFAGLIGVECEGGAEGGYGLRPWWGGASTAGGEGRGECDQGDGS